MLINNKKIEYNMTFSILVPAYKPQYLVECIDSVMSQTYQDWELIVVNDASPYDLDTIMAKYDDMRIRYYKNENGCGAENVVDNWNICLSYATGKYCICIGDDDRLLPRCLELYHNLISSGAKSDVYHIRTEVIDEKSNIIDIQEGRPEYESVYSMMWHRMCQKRRQYIGDFLFDIEALRNEGGFIKFPYACFSDDISSYRAAIKYGIYNINEVGFQYRENRHTITNTQNLRRTADAVVDAIRWMENLISCKDNTDDVDILYCRLLKDFLPKRKTIFLIDCYVRDLKSSNIIESVKYWKDNREKYGIPKNVFWRLAFGVWRRKMLTIKR